LLTTVTSIFSPADIPVRVMVEPTVAGGAVDVAAGAGWLGLFPDVLTVED
jgi:L-serine deaminase